MCRADRNQNNECVLEKRANETASKKRKKPFLSLVRAVTKTLVSSPSSTKEG